MKLSYTPVTLLLCMKAWNGTHHDGLAEVFDFLRFKQSACEEAASDSTNSAKCFLLISCQNLGESNEEHGENVRY